MQSFINNPFSEELREKSKFYEKKYGYKLYGEIFVTNKYGANAAQTGKTSDFRQDDEVWWQKATQEGVYIGDVKYDESAGIYSIEIDSRVEDKDGNFLGVLKSVLNIQEAITITDNLLAQSTYKDPEVNLLDHGGRIIYSNEQFIIFDEFPFCNI